MQKNVKIQLAILVLVILSIIIITVDFLVELSPFQRSAIYTVDFMICVILALEFLYRLKTSENYIGFLKKYWYELFALIPAYAFSLLELHILSVPARSLRFIRIFRAIRLLRAGVLYARIFKFLNTFWEVIIESKIPYLLILAISTILASTVAVYSLEYSVPTSPIKSIFDALWWTLTTLTTVGYGDIIPITPEGKIIGVILMIFGIGVWTAAISLLTATLVEKRHRKGKTLNAELVSIIRRYGSNIHELTSEDRQLLAKLIELTPKFSCIDKEDRRG